MAQKEDTSKPPGKRRSLMTWIYFALFALIFLPYILPSLTGTSPQEITWKYFEEQILPDRVVDKIEVVNNELADIYLKPDSLNKPKYRLLNQKNIFGASAGGPQYVIRIGSVDVFVRDLEKAQANVPQSQQIAVKYVKQENWLGNVLSWVLPFLLIIGLWFFLFRGITKTPGGTGAMSPFNFGKSRAVMTDKNTNSKITFKDVAGYDELKVEIMEVVEFLKKPENFTRLGAKIPRGVLLIGPPGTGKTLMAKAVAGEANVPFFSLSGPEFIEMFVGVGASRVRDLFEKAKNKAPSIIFIDEIDTIGRRRGRTVSIQVDDERESTLNQLLSEMDGFDEKTGVIVLAATNRADILDPALVRPGRFDRHIYLELPNKVEREAIFNVHLQPVKYDKSKVDIKLLAAQTPGFSGADIANVCNEAALIAVRQNKNIVDEMDFNEAIDKVVAGTEKKTLVISPREKEIISYHEAGHAITGWMLKNIDPLIKVSIIPRGKSLGSAWYLPEENKITTRAKFNDQLCAALGGRAAEALQFHEISSGALDDLEKATKLAYSMVALLGLDAKVGNVSFYDSTGMQEQTFQKPYSDSTAALIDEQVRNLLNGAFERASAILKKNHDKLDQLAKLLQEKEMVFREDIEKILGKKADG